MAQTEAKRLYMQQWRAQNKERIAAYMRDYTAANPERFTAIRRKRAAKANVVSARWKAANRDAIRAYNRRYTAERYRVDPIFRLKLTERNRMNDGLRGNAKVGPSTELLGCSWREFRAHLEARFTVGMTWENMGQWHVDHIRPLASFDLAQESEQRAAFHFSNHQPLWAVDNLRKGARVPSEAEVDRA